MKYFYQFGFSVFGLFVLWFTVSQKRFGAKVAPLILRSGQELTIQPAELLPMFTKNFVLRDGFRLYRAIPME